MPYRRRQQLHRAARRATQPGHRPNPAGRRRDGAPLLPTPPAAARPVLLPGSRTDATGEPERGGASSPRQGLDWARRTELTAIVLGVLLSPLIAAAGIWYANTQVRDQLTITQEGQITDRYTKAVETLGKKAMDVRLGGIYALQRIMEDSPRDHPTVANVLATYVRTHASKPLKNGAEVPADVHAALTVLVQRDATRDKSFSLDLRDTHLSGIELPSRRRDPDDPSAAPTDVLAGEDLWIGANLSGATLSGANLDSAILDSADLTAANLTAANLTDVNLIGADLIGAKLLGANLSGAMLLGANLSGADLTHARGLEVHEVISAVIDSRTMLPSGLAKDPAVTARIAKVDKERAEGRGVGQLP